MQPEIMWQMAKPVSTNDGARRQLDVVFDLNMNQNDETEAEPTDSWIRRHTVTPKNQSTTTTEHEQKPKSE